MMNSIFKYCAITFTSLIVLAISERSNAAVKAPAPYYYQIKVYHFKTKSQEERLDTYLQNAYLPAMHKTGVKNVGVFKPIKQDTIDKKLYVFIPSKTWEALETRDQSLMKDPTYLTAAKDYLDAPFNDPAYSRIETILLRAFTNAPEPSVPNLTAKKTDRIYEMRSYESASEKYNASKVKMFNAGDEIGIFKSYDFNAVFYAQVIAGSHMPNLMYMTTFNSMEDNKAKWKLFFADEKFKALGKMAEYQKNVSKGESFFLYPTNYSDY